MASVSASAARSRSSKNGLSRQAASGEDAAILLAGLLRVDGVHVDAERAAVDLGGADAHELAQARLELGAGVECGDRAVDAARGRRGREMRGVVMRVP